jgi:hypothetical protein
MADVPVVEKAVDKAEAKAEADAKVATETHTTHGVRTMIKSPDIVASTITGAGIGALYGGPPGAVIGAGIGYLVERYRVLGGPVGALLRQVRGH